MLKGGQKKLDKNKDGKITGEDFKLLRGTKKGMRMGELVSTGNKKTSLRKAERKKQSKPLGYGSARTSGMGLQDESMKPGKIIKAKSGYGMSSNKKRAMAEARAKREQER